MKNFLSSSKVKSYISLLISFFTIDHDGVFFASSLTYFLLISLIPMQLIQTFLLNIFNIKIKGNMTTHIGVFLSNNSNGINIVQAIIIFFFTLYVASHGISVFMRICNKIYDDYQKILRVRITSLLFFIILTIFFAVFNSILSIFANINIKSATFLSLGQNLTNFITFCFIVFTLYLLGTRKYLKYYQMIPGVLFSSLIISLFISIYYLIISSSFIKEKIYGEFYSGISLLLTIYFISYVLVLGVKLNQVISFTLTKKDKTN